ncbi:MAG: hypothetical protein CM15mP74_06950 [Halieaceae bacterium]|nr:MAG: hypothetical protein CM15mP74_06950 [Halieaceae bacterium]
MSRWFAILLILASGDVWAHRFAPSLLDIRQIADTTFSATWKTPMQTVSETPIEPKWPDQCAVTSTSPWVQEGTGMLMQIGLTCESGLVGKEVSVSGLGQNQSSALLRVTLAAASFIRRCSPQQSQYLSSRSRVQRAPWHWTTPGWVQSISGPGQTTCCL